ncbi:MAG: YicC family protein [Candidatus Riflebacteria bacterium]|nr:YicC family protein [Candidatus Riflebacteria bacterium]
MARSLTGFGRSELIDEIGRVSVEIKSVNNRFLQIDPHLPLSYNWIEGPIRSLISEKITRGKISINLEVVENVSANELLLNKPLLSQLIDFAASLEKDKGIKIPYNLDGFLSLPGVLKIGFLKSDSEQGWKRISPVIEEALNSLTQTRLREGQNLTEDLKKRQKKLLSLLQNIEKQFPIFQETFKRKFSSRISELLKETPLDEMRLATEIALWTDKSDISEEITRLKSHLSELESILMRDDPIGRRLDFLLQEINREANTINNKTGDLSIINDVLEIKCEIEKIREQAQNLE